MPDTITLPTESQAEAACNYMAAEIHAPAFFEKLSSLGIEPRTEAEAGQLLEIGAMLHRAEAKGQYKSAAAVAQEQTNPFLAAVLDRFRPQATQEDVDETLNKFAAEAVQSDELAKAAALIFNHVIAGGELAKDKTEENAKEE